MLGLPAAATHEAIPEAAPLPLRALGYSVPGYENMEYGS